MSRDRRSFEERSRVFELRSVPFSPPIGLLPENYQSAKEARRSIYEQFGVPLSTLPDEMLAEIDVILGDTLNRREVYRRVKDLFARHQVEG